MSSALLQKQLITANDKFLQRKYDEALRIFAKVLDEDPQSKAAYNGAIISEMALSGENGAEALFDYYHILRLEDEEKADNIIKEILETMQDSIEDVANFLEEHVPQRVTIEDGIEYSDFRRLLDEGADFKETFENIMFSTKVLITEKSDFIDFLNRLIENNFKEMAMRYIESAMNHYPNDVTLQKLLKSIIKGDSYA